ncbi:nitrous oxide reductase family maturation protein NosD [Actinoplanes sp. TFC3]|uniref:right-handed parallel beta-helix repeat-containing protein n=1 Tax=Actinoplanes sp. TFC3 TaxID=1710355 RepID=UPI000B13CD23|nr:right-handed parallel beta-helix repeat-containing protein [Actinoplanes sp. TFC3]
MRRRPLPALPGGLGVWLGGAALVVALIALIITVTRDNGPAPGANGPVGATGPVGNPDPPLTSPQPTGPVSTPASDPASAPASAPAPAPVPVDCPAATVTVTDAATLTAALTQAAPGASIHLQDGTYQGTFVAATKGTAEQPISLCGGAGAVLDAGNVKKGYGLHLDGADHWRVSGFTVRNAQKGVMGDGVHNAVISGLTVEQIGDEAIHLRKFSTGNIVENNVIRETGKRRDKFGEGVYIGSAQSNWSDISGGQPDASDRNTVRGNTISATTAEAIDVKEGTTGGTVSGNTFDGAALTGADSWVDIKGNNWTISGNTGVHSTQDGFQTHSVADGWGKANTFTANTATVDGPGFGFHFAPVEDNRLTCDNKASSADSGLANVPCSK